MVVVVAAVDIAGLASSVAVDMEVVAHARMFVVAVDIAAAVDIVVADTVADPTTLADLAVAAAVASYFLLLLPLAYY